LGVGLVLVGYPDGGVRALTSDTNNYSRASLSADGKMMAATQGKLWEELSVVSAETPGEWHAVPLSSRQPVMAGGWMPDGRLVLPQAGEIRIINPAGGETVVRSDAKHMADAVVSCGEGQALVYRPLGMSGPASVNLWVMNADGTNQRPLTKGQNQVSPACAGDGKWVYFSDRDDHGYIKRVDVNGGAAETVVSAAIGQYSLSHDGKKILSTDVREFDHRMVWRVDDVETHKAEYYEADQKALGSAKFSPDAKDVIYPVREHAVDNLWKRRLEGGAPQQITHFTAEKILGFAYSPDGKKLAMLRGHVDSDVVLLKDVGR